MRVYRKITLQGAERITDKCIVAFHNDQEVLIPISQIYDDLALGHTEFWVAEWIIGKNFCGLDPEDLDVLMIDNEDE